MEELIKIRKSDGGRNVVSARDLHIFLEVKKHFTEWFSDNSSQFSESVDYQALHLKVKAGPGYSMKIDYLLTIDTAKEMAMMSKVAKGKIVRQYFIACEKKLKELATPKELSRKDLALLIIQAEEEKERVVLQLDQATKQIEADKPKVVFADSVSVSNDAILIGELAKILKQNGVEIGQNRLFKWLRENGYLIRRSATDYNMPTQFSMEKRLFKIKETSIAHSDGRVTISKTAKVTGEGQLHFINRFLTARQ